MSLHHRTTYMVMGLEMARLRGEEPGRDLLRAALAAIETPGTVTLPA
jgi:transposase